MEPILFDIHYMRVFPRDLFNEAKLLKCAGLLCLKILDYQAPKELSYNDDENDTSPLIGLSDDGSLSMTNLNVMINGKRAVFITTYNSKSNYPFYMRIYGKRYDEFEDIPVFTESGEFETEFLEYINKNSFIHN